jgi:hypothetical protein
MNRRGFLAACLAGCVAPAVVHAAWLMPVRQLESGIVTLSPDKMGAFATFTEQLLREISDGLGISYESISRDYQHMEYSAARLQLETEWQWASAR